MDKIPIRFSRYFRDVLTGSLGLLVKDVPLSRSSYFPPIADRTLSEFRVDPDITLSPGTGIVNNFYIHEPKGKTDPILVGVYESTDKKDLQMFTNEMIGKLVNALNEIGCNGFDHHVSADEIKIFAVPENGEEPVNFIDIELQGQRCSFQMSVTAGNLRTRIQHYRITDAAVSIVCGGKCVCASRVAFSQELLPLGLKPEFVHDANGTDIFLHKSTSPLSIISQDDDHFLCLNKNSTFDKLKEISTKTIMELLAKIDNEIKKRKQPLRLLCESCSAITNPGFLKLEIGPYVSDKGTCLDCSTQEKLLYCWKK